MSFYKICFLTTNSVVYIVTRIMVYKGMVYKGKYWISEKNKGIPVSFFG